MKIAGEDDWDAAAAYRACDGEWRYCADTTEYLLETQVGAHRWMVRMNDFPDEPLYTLFIEGEAIIDFNDWPKGWKDRPSPWQQG